MNKFYTIKTKQNATRNFDKWFKKQFTETIPDDLSKMRKILQQLSEQMEYLDGTHVQFKSFHAGEEAEETPSIRR